MFKADTRQTAVGLRSYSSQAAKAQNLATSLLTKSTAVAKTGLYYTKVFGELAKYVWVKEGLSPPTAAEFQKAFTTDLKAFYQKALQYKNEAAKDPAKAVDTFQSFTSSDYIKGSAIVLQLLGIFALGEIIGRRHIYGYADHSHDH